MDIDFVVLWVDGSDPVWQAEKQNIRAERWMTATPPTGSVTGA